MNERSSRWTIVCLLLCASALAACGTSSTSDNGNNGTATTLLSCFPKSGEVTGWTEDTTRTNHDGTASNASGPDSVTTVEAAVALIDGSFEKFKTTGGWVKMATEYYKDSNNMRILLSIHEYSTTEATAPIMTIFTNETYTTTSLGAGELGAMKYSSAPLTVDVIGRKGKFFFSVLMDSNTGSISNMTQAETLATAFATAVANKIK